MVVGVCGGGREVSSRPKRVWVLSQPRVISIAFVPVAYKACPTCGMQHAQSDLQSTCLANQPLHCCILCLSMPANAARPQRDETYSFSCSSVIVWIALCVFSFC